MTNLITGAAGMVGSHLFERLRRAGERVIGTYYRPTVDVDTIDGHNELIELDVRYRGEVEAMFRTHRPNVVYHLAAQSLPTRSWSSPEETLEVNVLGTVNVFEAIKSVRRDHPDYDPVVVVACSSAEYGASLTPENVPISEDVLLQPLHPYGVSKVGQDLLTFQYWRCDKIRGVRARIFNSTGPRKRGDVVSDFARRVALIEHTGAGELVVGNLTPQRAILDVQDLISALVLLAEKGKAGDVYNISSERVHSIADVVKLFESVSGRRLPTRVDPALLRPSDEPVIFGSTAKLRAHTGWGQVRRLEETVSAVLEYERERIKRLGA